MTRQPKPIITAQQAKKIQQQIIDACNRATAAMNRIAEQLEERNRNRG